MTRPDGEFQFWCLILVEPFSEIGMVVQVSAIQSVMDQPSRSSCDPSTLPVHLQELLDQTWMAHKGIG